jgi:hypothetical protein
MALIDDLNKLEADIEKLKKDYDQYFLGFEKRPPEKLRNDCERAVRGMIGVKTPNTGLKFRANVLVQKMAAYRQLWDRTLKQIEEGTYKRDVFRANLHDKWRQEAQARNKRGPAQDDVIEDAELIDDAPAPPKYGSVFDAYVKARTETNEGAGGISYDKLHDVLEKQAEQIRTKYGAKDVDFKVVIENGKARLKATPKK